MVDSVLAGESNSMAHWIASEESSSMTELVPVEESSGMVDSAPAGKPESRLLNLPREIRDRIYKETVADDRTCPKCPKSTACIASDDKPPGLLATCRQTREFSQILHLSLERLRGTAIT